MPKIISSRVTALRHFLAAPFVVLVIVCSLLMTAMAHTARAIAGSKTFFDLLPKALREAALEARRHGLDDF